jgi:hypothetical protein
MPDFEVCIDLSGKTRPVGIARCNRVRGTETIVFEYSRAWLDTPERFALEPALALTRGTFSPHPGLATFGSIGDSAPDTWGRRLMQRAERRLAARERRAVHTLNESDYLLGVADETRLGALRFRWLGDDTFQAPTRIGVPPLIELGRLLQITERILRDEETDEDLQLIFAPGSSLGGARPKASVVDQHGHLSIAKFPKETDEYLTEHGARAKSDAQALYRRVAFNVLISNVDDHLRNHGFLWSSKAGWSLSPAYDINPVPADLKARVLSTNINLDEGTCSIDLLEASSEYFALNLAQARGIIKEVATVTATWHEVAKTSGARSDEINRMASAFEHEDLRRALTQ